MFSSEISEHLNFFTPTLLLVVFQIWIRMDPHHSEKQDSDPHQSGKLDLDPHQSKKHDPNRVKVKRWKP
jgi:hypothetical protein